MPSRSTTVVRMPGIQPGSRLTGREHFVHSHGGSSVEWLPHTHRCYENDSRETLVRSHGGSFSRVAFQSVWLPHTHRRYA